MFPEHGKKVLRMLNVFQSVSPTAQVLLAVTLLWLAGFGMSRITKLLHLPNVTGYILAGVVIGPYVLNLIPAELTGGMEFLTDVALSFIAFGVGRYLRLDRLKEQGTRVIVLTLMEALVTAAVRYADHADGVSNVAALCAAVGRNRLGYRTSVQSDDHPAVSCQGRLCEHADTGGRHGRRGGAAGLQRLCGHSRRARRALRAFSWCRAP